MRLARIELHNWGCYAGDVRLELEAKPYAIVARHRADAERSNWLGKTTLVEAVPFALHGEHRARTEDGWITRGEKTGGVTLYFDNGMAVKRTRVLGKSTQLTFQVPGGEAMKQDEAQHEIDRRLGLTKEDFNATCYFEQKAMARLILAKPEERMGIVSGWLRLEPLERAEKKVRDSISTIADKAASLSAQMDAAMASERDELAARGRQSLEDLTTALAEKRTALASAQSVAFERANAFQRNEEIVRQRSRIVEHTALCNEGREAREQTLANPVKPREDAYAEASAAEREAAALLTRARQDVQAKRKLARGEFDGRCPVAEIECPVKAQINDRRKANATLAATAEKAEVVAQRVHENLSTVERRQDAELQAARRTADRLLSLREREAKMRSEVEAAKRLPEPASQGDLRRAWDEAVGQERELALACNALADSVKRIEHARTVRAKVSGDIAAREVELGTLREAAMLLGKGGAQRRVAEEALATIELTANEMLRTTGIDLSVEVRWAREGKGMAKACEACGHPFPDSTKVKECTRCSTARGPLLVNKLTVEPSSRSGAAEDLAGAALQLAASSWLREERAAAWEVALIDEPFGALDASHRRSFAGGLVQMLRECGFRQAFIIAHHAAVLDTLPGRIEIESDGQHATARVVA